MKGGITVSMHDSITEHDLILSHGTLPPGVTSSPLYRMVVAMDDGVRLSVSGEVCTMTAGSLLLVAPYALLYVPTQADSGEVHMYTFSAQALLSQGIPVVEVFAGAPYRTPADQPDGVPTLLARLRDTEGTDGIALTLVKLMLTEIVVRLSTMPLEREAHSGVARAAAYLAEHIEEEVTLDDLSETVGISKFYLCRAFSRDSGLTPHAYLNHLRAYRAKELLADGMGAAEVATTVGFSDYSTFFRTYRKIIGRSPTAANSEAVK